MTVLRKTWIDLGPYRVLLLPVAVLLVGVFVLPQVGVFWKSVGDNDEGLGIFVQLFASAGIRQIFLTTLELAAVSTAITIVGAYVLAFVIVHVGSVHSRVLLLLVLFSFWISALIRALAWLILLTDQGVLNTALISLGVIDEPVRLAFSSTGVLIGMVHFLLPICTLALIAGLSGIDPTLARAARGLGASRTAAFLRVYLPLSIPSLFGAGIVTFVLALGFYIVPTLLGDGRSTVVAEYITFEVLEYANWLLPSAAAIVLVVVTVAMIMVAVRLVGSRNLGLE